MRALEQGRAFTLPVTGGQAGGIRLQVFSSMTTLQISKRKNPTQTQAVTQAAPLLAPCRVRSRDQNRMPVSKCPQVQRAGISGHAALKVPCSPLRPGCPAAPSSPYCSQRYLLAAQRQRLCFCHPKCFDGGDAGEKLCYTVKGSTQAFVNSSVYSCHKLLQI